MKGEKSFAEGLRSIDWSKWKPKLTEAERRLFDQARFAQEQAKKSTFVLGDQRKRGCWII